MLTGQILEATEYPMLTQSACFVDIARDDLVISGKSDHVGSTLIDSYVVGQ